MAKKYFKRYTFPDGQVHDVSAEDAFITSVKQALSLAEMGDPSVLNRLAKRTARAECLLLTKEMNQPKSTIKRRTPTRPELEEECNLLLVSGVSKSGHAAELAKKYHVTAGHINRILRS